MNEVVVERSEFESTYKTTRSIAQSVSSVGWLLVIGGLLAVVISISTAMSSRYGFELVAVIPALGVLVVGLLLVMQGQLTRAVADTADSASETAAILRVMMKQQQVTTTPVKDSQVL